MTSAAAPTPLTEMLRLDPLGDDRFRAGPTGLFSHRIYGGEVAGQALVAAAATVDADRPMNSAHVHFLRPGNPAEPLDHVVERVRDSRSLATRLVRTEQTGRTLALTTVSFHVVRDFPAEHQVDANPAPEPDDLPRRADELAAIVAGWPADAGRPPEVTRRSWPIDIRYVDRSPYDPTGIDPGAAEPVNRLWMRATETLADDPVTHRAALAWATDFPMFEPSLFPHDVRWLDAVNGRAWFGSSLDHTVFFHRPLRADEWLLMVQHNPIVAGSRGLAEAKIYARDGRLVATVVQESVMTPPVSDAS